MHRSRKWFSEIWQEVLFIFKMQPAGKSRRNCSDLHTVTTRLANTHGLSQSGDTAPSIQNLFRKRALSGTSHPDKGRWMTGCFVLVGEKTVIRWWLQRWWKGLWPLHGWRSWWHPRCRQCSLWLRGGKQGGEALIEFLAPTYFHECASCRGGQWQIDIEIFILDRYNQMFPLDSLGHTCDCVVFIWHAPQSTELCGHAEPILCSRIKIIDCSVVRGVMCPINFQNVGPAFVHLSVPGQC